MSTSNFPTLHLLRKISDHLTRRRKFQLFCLLFIMLASSFAELISLGSVMPFLAVLTSPETLWQQPLVQSVALYAGFTEAKQLVLPASLCFALASALAASIRILNLWLSTHLAAAIGSDLSSDAYRKTLLQPYQIHVKRNSSSLVTALITHVGKTSASVDSLLRIVSSIVVAIGLLVGLFLIDWQVALSTGLLFGLAYGLIAVSLRRKMRFNGSRIATANTLRVKTIQEGLGAIRDVLLDNSHATYLDVYSRSDRPERFLAATNLFLKTFPRYLLEALGLIVIAVMGAFLVLQRGGGASVIPLLGALALGAQRLLPAFQQIYSGWASLKGSTASIAVVADLLDQPLPQQLVVQKSLPLHHGISLRGVSFRYSSGLSFVLQDLDLEIRKGERIGLIGSTGCGKSTLVDLLMGLLPPTSGKLLIDGHDLHDPMHEGRLASWRAAVAHVPQSIFLADSSIAENIAFGVSKNSIDMDRVKQAANQAQIASFIESNPDGYATYVGERGIRLSGGQRQRIGIARALYKQASVIILDEATSALDTNTEETLIKSVESLSRDLTMVMIAHRLTTLQRCDRVIHLDRGTLVANGPPSVVLANTP